MAQLLQPERAPKPQQGRQSGKTLCVRSRSLTRTADAAFGFRFDAAPRHHQPQRGHQPLRKESCWALSAGTLPGAHTARESLREFATAHLSIILHGLAFVHRVREHALLPRTGEWLRACLHWAGRIRGRRSACPAPRPSAVISWPSSTSFGGVLGNAQNLRMGFSGLADASMPITLRAAVGRKAHHHARLRAAVTEHTTM